MQESFDNLRQAIDRLLKTKSSVKRKKHNKQIQNRDLFVNVINSIQMLTSRANILYTDLKLDFSSYDEPFLEIIDTLLLLRYGKEGCDLISYYLWERENPDGTLNELYDENDNIVPLENPIDLWNVLIKLNPDAE
jgi:hypothetical protein